MFLFKKIHTLKLKLFCNFNSLTISLLNQNQ